MLLLFCFLSLLQPTLSAYRNFTGSEIDPGQTVPSRGPDQASDQSGALVTSKSSVPVWITDSCCSLWYSHVFPSGSFKDTYTITEIYKTITTLDERITYTTCDQIPRVKFLTTPTLTSTSTLTIVYTGTAEIAGDGAPKPTCSCDKLDQLAREREKLPEFKEKSETCWLTVEDEVVLIYWPPNSAFKNICPTKDQQRILVPENNDTPITISTDAITFRGQEIGLATVIESYKVLGSDTLRYQEWVSSFVLKGPFTFTSPTVYLAHRDIFRDGVTSSNVFDYRDRSSFLPPGIIPVNPIHVSTIGLWREKYNISGVEYAQRVAKGLFSPPRDDGGYEKIEKISPIDFGSLQDPVPADIYYDGRASDCWAQQTHCGTITEGAYRPRLIFNSNFWSSAFPGLKCTWTDLVDPPLALSQVTSFARPVDPAETSAVLPELLSQEARPGKGSPYLWPAATTTAGCSDLTHGGKVPADHPNGEGFPDPTFSAHKGQTITVEGRVTTLSENAVSVDSGSPGGLKGGAHSQPSGTSPAVHRSLAQKIGWSFPAVILVIFVLGVLIL